MLYRHMYCCYPDDNNIILSDNTDVITSTFAMLDDLGILYYETENENLLPEDVIEAEITPFPDGELFYKMPDIFHYFVPETPNEWKRKIKGKKPSLTAMQLHYDKVSEYIYHHYYHQENNQWGVDKYCSIYIFKNIIVMYREFPVEKIKLEELKGKESIPVLSSEWDAMMAKIFKGWDSEDNTAWRDLEILDTKGE